MNYVILTAVYTCTLPSSTLYIHTPRMPTLLVREILIKLDVRDPGIVIYPIPSPTLIPARALLLHCIPPSAYRNIAKVAFSLVASTH